MSENIKPTSSVLVCLTMRHPNYITNTTLSMALRSVGSCGTIKSVSQSVS